MLRLAELASSAAQWRIASHDGGRWRTSLQSDAHQRGRDSVDRWMPCRRCASLSVVHRLYSAGFGLSQIDGCEERAHNGWDRTLGSVVGFSLNGYAGILWGGPVRRESSLMRTNLAQGWSVLPTAGASADQDAHRVDALSLFESTPLGWNIGAADDIRGDSGNPRISVTSRFSRTSRVGNTIATPDRIRPASAALVIYRRAWRPYGLTPLRGARRYVGTRA